MAVGRIQWTQEMDGALREGLRRGWTLAAIAENVGVAEGTARRRADELGLERPKRQRKAATVRAPRVTMEMRFAEYLAQGHPPKVAGDLVGCARGNSMLQRIRSKLGAQAV